MTHTQWDTPIGEARLNRQQRNAALDAHNAKVQAQYAREVHPDQPLKAVRGATPAGDEDRLRGVPIQARGVGGTIRGTQPHSALRDRNT